MVPLTDPRHLLKLALKLTHFNGFQSSRLRRPHHGRMRLSEHRKSASLENAHSHHKSRGRPPIRLRKTSNNRPLRMRDCTRCARTRETRQRRRRKSMSMKSRPRSAPSLQTSHISQQVQKRHKLRKPPLSVSKELCRSN